MINFRWGQAAGQASGLNLAAARAISRRAKKRQGEAGEKEGARERGEGHAQPRRYSTLQRPAPSLPTWRN